MVRAMRQDDKKPVMSLLLETGVFTAEEQNVAEELIDTYLHRKDQKDYFVFVAEDGSGRVVGYLTYGPTPMTEGTYDLYWIAVAPGEQGRGFGRELVEALERELRDRRGRLILVETSSQPRYRPAREFYLRLGYKEVARIPDFYKPGDDRITYAKYFF